MCDERRHILVRIKDQAPVNIHLRSKCTFRAVLSGSTPPAKAILYFAIGGQRISNISLKQYFGNHFLFGNECLSYGGDNIHRALPKYAML